MLNSRCMTKIEIILAWCCHSHSSCHRSVVMRFDQRMSKPRRFAIKWSKTRVISSYHQFTSTLPLCFRVLLPEHHERIEFAFNMMVQVRVWSQFKHHQNTANSSQCTYIDISMWIIFMLSCASSGGPTILIFGLCGFLRLWVCVPLIKCYTALWFYKSAATPKACITVADAWFVARKDSCCWFKKSYGALP